MTFKQAGWTLGPVSASGKRRTLTLHGIGKLRLFWSRELEGRVKTVTLKRDTCVDWFVLFSCDGVPECVLPTAGGAVGIDMGLESFLTTSDGKHIANARPRRAASAEVRKAQRVVSKRARGAHLGRMPRDAWPSAIAPSSARAGIPITRMRARWCSSAT